MRALFYMLYFKNEGPWKSKEDFLLMFCVCHSVCTPYVCKNFRGHKESDPLELELERGVSLYVGAGNWEQ